MTPTRLIPRTAILVGVAVSLLTLAACGPVSDLEAPVPADRGPAKRPLRGSGGPGPGAVHPPARTAKKGGQVLRLSPGYLLGRLRAVRRDVSGLLSVLRRDNHVRDRLRERV